MGEPKVVLWDIENSQNLAAVFQLKHNDYINAENIFRERFIICAAWKELGKPKVHSASVLDDAKRFKADPYDDRYVVTKLHEVLSGADVIIAHNGDEFDLKMTKGRMLAHGLAPLPPITSIDTLKVARTQFLLNANNLDYLGRLLKVGKKRKTSPGLWLRVLRGDRAAIREMVAYNKEDVILLEDVFLKLQPYCPNHFNNELTGGTGCPRCGSDRFQSRGVHRAISRTYQRFQCQACGGWWRAVKNTTLKTTKRVI
jgi:hemin uptake protein HemP